MTAFVTNISNQLQEIIVIHHNFLRNLCLSSCETSKIKYKPCPPSMGVALLLYTIKKI